MPSPNLSLDWLPNTWGATHTNGSPTNPEWFMTSYVVDFSVAQSGEGPELLTVWPLWLPGELGVSALPRADTVPRNPRAFPAGGLRFSRCAAPFRALP
jgi:hypothetical protein